VLATAAWTKWSKQLKAVLKGYVDNNCIEAAKQEHRWYDAIPVAADLCAGCGAFAAAVLGNKRLACVAVVDVGVLPSVACMVLPVGGVLMQL
jgi:hypothetical protein